MAYIIDENGNITMYQGDTVILPIEGLEEGKNFTIYVALYDENRKPVGQEQSSATLGETSINITLPASLTDLCTVPKGEDYATYYYGIKTVLDGSEDTMFIGENADFGTLNTIAVYPRKVVGAE